MGTLLKKLTTLVKDGIIGADSLPLENKVKSKPDAHKVVLGRNKVLLQNPSYGSRKTNGKK
jgi:hypothetical protein